MPGEGFAAPQCPAVRDAYLKERAPAFLRDSPFLP